MEALDCDFAVEEVEAVVVDDVVDDVEVGEVVLV